VKGGLMAIRASARFQRIEPKTCLFCQCATPATVFQRSGKNFKKQKLKPHREIPSTSVL
jgi:hypothetical protein